MLLAYSKIQFSIIFILYNIFRLYFLNNEICFSLPRKQKSSYFFKAIQKKSQFSLKYLHKIYLFYIQRKIKLCISNRYDTLELFLQTQQQYKIKKKNGTRSAINWSLYCLYLVQTGQEADLCLSRTQSRISEMLNSLSGHV